MVEIPIRHDSCQGSETEEVLDLGWDHLFQVIIGIVTQPSYLLPELIHFFLTILSDPCLELSIDLFLYFIPLFVPLIDFSTFEFVVLGCDFGTDAHFSSHGLGHDLLVILRQLAHVTIDALIDVVVFEHVVAIAIEPVVELLDHVVAAPESFIVLFQFLSHQEAIVSLSFIASALEHVFHELGHHCHLEEGCYAFSHIASNDRSPSSLDGLLLDSLLDLVTITT